MKLRLAVPAAVVLTATVVPAFPADYVYFAENRMSCTMEPAAHDGREFAVFVLLDEPVDVTGLEFRLDTDRFGPDNVDAVAPAPGVTIDEGDIFNGIKLAFTSTKGEDHEPVLMITLSGYEDLGYVWTRDIEVIRGAGRKYLDDLITVAYPYDCLVVQPHWSVPDVVDATVGETVIVTFSAGLQTIGFPGEANVRVVDHMGWVVEDEPLQVYASCEWCPWSMTAVSIPVYVPEGTPDKTLNEVSVEMQSLGSLVDEKSIVLRATDPVATEVTTWSRIKALYQ